MLLNNELLQDERIAVLASNRSIVQIQARAYNILLESSGVGRVGDGLLRRARYWSRGVDRSFSWYFEEVLREAGKVLAPGMLFSFLRLITNALNTSYRYRNKKDASPRLDCKWCGGMGGDWIWHLSVCQKLREDMHDRFPNAWFPQFPDEAAFLLSPSRTYPCALAGERRSTAGPLPVDRQGI